MPMAVVAIVSSANLRLGGRKAIWGLMRELVCAIQSSIRSKLIAHTWEEREAAGIELSAGQLTIKRYLDRQRMGCGRAF